MLIVCCVAGVVSTTTTLVNLNPPERFNLRPAFHEPTCEFRL